MKTLILAAIRCSLMFTAVTAFCVANPAKANTITTFNVSGTGERVATITGTTFSGTMTIDVTAGTLTAIDLSFQGVSRAVSRTSSGLACRTLVPILVFFST